ncbi:TetR/AcrR family transcriptional regulator [Fodinicola feengrottensis]|uniref:TetR/AcrR family transcriptional regulator n=1 Tax=Fodinicola feengrottensis TaxID=435914 RepID=A0ABN2H4E6_9ACTN
MARPRSFDVEEVLDAATLVFWDKGYAATTPQDLCDATGLGRGSLYNAFVGKRELFDRVLERYNAKGAVAQLAVLDQPTPVKDRIHALLMITLGEGGLAGRAGCLAVSTAVQLGGNDAELNRLLRKRFSQTEKALVAAIEFGQACGEIRKDVSAVLLARLVLSAMYGMTVVDSVFDDRKRLREIVDTAVAVL